VRRATQVDHCKSARLCRSHPPTRALSEEGRCRALIGLHQRRACCAPPKMINVVGVTSGRCSGSARDQSWRKLSRLLLQGQLLRARSSPRRMRATDATRPSSDMVTSCRSNNSALRSFAPDRRAHQLAEAYCRARCPLGFCQTRPHFLGCAFHATIRSGAHRRVAPLPTSLTVTISPSRCIWPVREPISA